MRVVNSSCTEKVVNEGCTSGVVTTVDTETVVIGWLSPFDFVIKIAL
jgi:hypothetical protein